MRKRYVTRMICLCLSVVLAACICKIDPVSAATDSMTILDITKGSITIGSDTISGFDEMGNEVSEANADGYHIIGHSETTFNSIKVTGGTHDVILDNVIINQGNLELSGSGTNVTAILVGKNELYSMHWTAAVQIPGNTTFIISEDSTGSLKAVGTSKRSSGIGVAGKSNMGIFIMNGGTVEAIGNGGECTAVGTGFNGSGGQIIINGGYLSAKIQNTSGGYGGTTVGGGFSSSNMDSIKVNGGTVHIEGSISKVADLEVNGGSFYYDSSSVTPHDSENNTLTINILQIPGISQATAVDKITLDGSIMNTKDVKTDPLGYITLLVPSTAINDELKIVMGDNEYIGTFNSGVKMKQSKVPAVSLLKKTSVMIQVNAEDGAEYSLDEGNSWQSDGIFTGLTPATEYKVVARMEESNICWAGSISTPLAVKTKRIAPNAPQAPNMKEKTDTSISVETAAGQEYSLDQNGSYQWQKSGMFNGLEAGREYQIVTRIHETEDAMASQVSNALVVRTKLNVAAPEAPVLISKTSDTIIVREESNQEYALVEDGPYQWQKSGMFNGLEAGREYQIVTRINETKDAMASQVSNVLMVRTKLNVAAPVAPVLISKTSDTIIVREESNQEYALVEDGSYQWQKSGIFTGLKSGKEYKIVTRVKETEDAMASPLSDMLKVTTSSTPQTDDDTSSAGGQDGSGTGENSGNKEDSGAIATGDTSSGQIYPVLFVMAGIILLMYKKKYI